MPRITRSRCAIHQADTVLSQTNPVSTTLYTVLDTQKNVRIIDAFVNVTWATTQPTPIEIVFNVDGHTSAFQKADPGSTVNYCPAFLNAANENGVLDTDTGLGKRAFLLEGRSVKVSTKITWATTQPTPLVCRVKWARIP